MLSLAVKIVLVWSVVIGMSVSLYFQLEKNRDDYRELLRQDILHEAVAHFDNMVVARSWNASHGGVYVKAHDGISPNPYLRDNVLKTEKDETLIKINPAWMTRQISELSNKRADYYYKITSLDPINPQNSADTFETEALGYFEGHKEQPYYWRMGKKGDGSDSFDFMGSLIVTKNCLACHAEQGYVVGDVRGGIRVSIPLDEYKKSMVFMDVKNGRNKAVFMGLSLLFGLFITFYLWRIERYHKEIGRLTEGLERKVDERTRELDEMNKTLERRVGDGVKLNRQKDEAMLTQSRYAAMGEMIGMLAHQWRQPIAVIEMGATNMLVDLELELDDKEEMTRQLEVITDETQALSKIITDFSSMFKEESAKSHVRPEELVDEALSIMQSSLEQHNITIVKQYSAENELLLLSRELFQVYLNLLNNAKEILIEREIVEPKIVILIEEQDKEILTHICDNAGGIEEAYLNKVFEPYFSTKGEKEGSGLGLFISKSIVEKKLDGLITVENGESGACFSIHLSKEEQ